MGHRLKINSRATSLCHLLSFQKWKGLTRTIYLIKSEKKKVNDKSRTIHLIKSEEKKVNEKSRTTSSFCCSSTSVFPLPPPYRTASAKRHICFCSNQNSNWQQHLNLARYLYTLCNHTFTKCSCNILVRLGRFGEVRVGLLCRQGSSNLDNSLVSASYANTETAMLSSQKIWSNK